MGDACLRYDGESSEGQDERLRGDWMAWGEESGSLVSNELTIEDGVCTFANERALNHEFEKH